MKGVFVQFILIENLPLKNYWKKITLCLFTTEAWECLLLKCTRFMRVHQKSETVLGNLSNFYFPQVKSVNCGLEIISYLDPK